MLADARLTPAETLIPRLPTFRRTPGAILMLFRNRKGIAFSPKDSGYGIFDLASSLIDNS